jgi:Na+-translocating ferredoxin:NAD+ oxidoreductase subunit B
MNIGSIIVISSLVLLALAGFFGFILGFFSRMFKVKEDPRVEKIMNILPGANCGACGLSGCQVFAEAVLSGKARIDSCRAGGEETINEISRALGISTENAFEKKIAVALCHGGRNEANVSAIAEGVSSCQMAKNLKLNPWQCHYTCLGYGDCVAICPFGAIAMSDDGLPVIDPLACKGCGICVDKCPQQIIELFPYDTRVLCFCRNTDKGSLVRQACKVGCIACNICEKKCPENAIQIINNLPVVDIEKCTLCGICVSVCPTKAITLFQALSEKKSS